MQRVIVKKSNIHGKGVFASRNFKKGEIVLKWKPKFLSKSDTKELSEKDKHFLYKVGKKYLLEQPPERFVNHSCMPNTRVMGYSDVALRNIKKGEEITSRYGKASLPVGFICECGSHNCKKKIK